MKVYSEAAIQAMSEGLIVEVEQFLANPKREQMITSLVRYITSSLKIMGSLYVPMMYFEHTANDKQG